MRSLLVVVAAFGFIFALSEASALKSHSQAVQYSCDVNAIKSTYEDIWEQVWDLRDEVIANAQAIVNNAYNCLSYLYNPEKVWTCVVEVVQEEVNNTLQDWDDYLSNTKTLCDTITTDIKSCVTL